MPNSLEMASLGLAASKRQKFEKYLYMLNARLKKNKSPVSNKKTVVVF